MTPASPNTPTRHDTLQPVTGRSGRGTARQTIRADEPLWETFGENTARVDSDRSAVLREFMRWFNGEPGAELPQRPEPRTD